MRFGFAARPVTKQLFVREVRVFNSKFFAECQIATRNDILVNDPAAGFR